MGKCLESEDLVAEISILKRLHTISTNLNKHHDKPQTLFEEIIDAAINLTNASNCGLQLADEKTKSLKLMAQRGLSAHFIEHYLNISHDRGTSGHAYKNKTRVIVEDVISSSIYIGTQEFQVVFDEGIRALQSTPLISSSGKFIGVLTTAYIVKHGFEESELQLLDMLAQLAADAVERTLFIEVLKQSNIQALSLVEELRKADCNKNNFINILSHEIRNPMASIMMSLSLLEKLITEKDEVRKVLEIAKRQTNQLAHLVDDLMDVSRISTNKIKLKKKCTDLNKLITQIVDEHKVLFAEKGLHLEMKVSEAIITMEADATRLKQAVGNLLQNAAKFTSSGQKTLVTLARDEDNQEAVISVKDNGIGITPEILPDLFQPFMQAGQSLDRAQGGLGLGLNIVKGMVELHGGSVSAYSKGLGEGAEFTLRLPLSLHDPVQMGANKKTSSIGKILKSMRIMVIDDIPDVVDALSSLLRHLGHDVISAYNGFEGVRKIKEYCPEVVLCDISLPVMSGYDVALHIRNDIELKDIYLIALSSYAQPDDIEKAKRSGFDRHLAKPIKLVDLEQIITEARRNIAISY